MLAFGATYLVLIGFMGSSVSTTYGITASDSWVEEAGLAIFPALFALVPLALVMGILRYRLWEIDVLVSKTLLSVGLVGVHRRGVRRRGRRSSGAPSGPATRPPSRSQPPRSQPSPSSPCASGSSVWPTASSTASGRAPTR